MADGPKSLAFALHLIEELDHLIQPLRRLLSPSPPGSPTLRKEVQRAIETQIGQLREVREADLKRYPIQRLLDRIAATLG